MRELLARLFGRPIIGIEVIACTFLSNVMALATPLFVMTVLRRYVGQGVDATLITLTTGALIAVFMEFVFTQIRAKLAQGLSLTPDRRMGMEGFNILTQAKSAALDRVPPGKRQEIVGGVAAVETAYSASNITAVLDVPFALLFVGVLFLLSPTIGIIVLFFLVVVFFSGTMGARAMRDDTQKLTDASAMSSSLVGTAIREMETVRVFNAGDFMRRAWLSQLDKTQALRRRISWLQGFTQTITKSTTGLMSITVITIAATLVVAGELDIGIMIACNILGARALQPVSRFAQLGSTFAKAREALVLLDEFAKLPLEPESGSAKAEYNGGLELRDLAFMYPESSGPLFESLSLKLQPGSLLLVTGSNGTGKTTLARLLVGLIEPVRGQILADGLDLNQVAPEWWRRQVVYMPQEPAFLNATIEENLRLANPEIDMESLNRIVTAAGLREFIDESPNNFETPITDNGRQLAMGIRRRLALARALVSGGTLAIFDEPLEGMDAEGSKAVRKVIGHLASRGRTIVILAHDPNIVRGAHARIDLNVKPTPEVTILREAQKPEAVAPPDTDREAAQ